MALSPMGWSINRAGEVAAVRRHRREFSVSYLSRNKAPRAFGASALQAFRGRSERPDIRAARPRAAASLVSAIRWRSLAQAAGKPGRANDGRGGLRARRLGL